MIALQHGSTAAHVLYGVVVLFAMISYMEYFNQINGKFVKRITKWDLPAELDTFEMLLEVHGTQDRACQLMGLRLLDCFECTKGVGFWEPHCCLEHYAAWSCLRTWFHSDLPLVCLGLN